ncbi:hypothetical protein MALU111345_05290 [Marinicrinis lubricantis]
MRIFREIQHVFFVFTGDFKKQALRIHPLKCFNGTEHFMRKQNSIFGLVL